MFRKILLVGLLIVAYLSVVWQPADGTSGDVIVSNQNSLPGQQANVSVIPSNTPTIPPPPDIAEGGARGFTISLTIPLTEAAEVLVSVSDPSRCEVTPTIVTMLVGTSTGNMSVTAYDNAVADGDHPCTLITSEIFTSDPNYIGMSVPDVDIMIIDDDSIDTPIPPTDTPIPPTDTPVPPTDTPTGPATLVASAACNLENLEVTITAGDGPFNITASAGVNTPVNGVSTGTTTINGPEKWDDLTVVETAGDMQSINLGQFRCRSDEVPVPLTPAHRSHTTNPFPLFSWTGITGANNYRVFVFDDANPATRTVDIRQNSGGPTSMNLTTPLPDGRLFWRVRGRQNRLWSLWSVRFTLFKDPAPPLLAPTPVPTIDLSPPRTVGPVVIPTFPPPPNSR